MVNIAKVFSIFVVVFASAITNASGLTEEAVKKLIAKVDNAAVTLNADAVADALSSNVIIIMNIKSQGQTHVMKPTKKDYILMLKQGWAAYKNYTYTKSNVKIRMLANKAIVTSNVSESMTVQGQRMSGESREEVTVELVNGKPLITKVVGYTSM